MYKSEGGENASLVCPRCYSEKIWRDGKRKNKKNVIQRYYCRDCDYRFSLGKLFSTSFDKISKRQVCDIEEESKNLIVVEKKNLTTGEISEIKGKLLEYSWYHEKQGYAKSTRETRVRILTILHKRGADLFDPESVKEVIAKQEWSNGRKANAVDAFNIFLLINEGEWIPPVYKRGDEKPPYIPTEKEINDLIAGTGPKTSMLLHLLKETGLRISEAVRITWDDIDYERCVVRILASKGSNSRICRISKNLVNKIVKIKASNNTRDKKRVFGKNIRSVRRVFSKQRNRIAEKLGNDKIRLITFHTLRHWYGTVRYHQTKDLLCVQKELGHKSISSTMRYIDYDNAYFKDFDEKYVCKIAKTVEEAKDLIELGFNFVTEIDGSQLFRKNKSIVGPVS